MQVSSSFVPAIDRALTVIELLGQTNNGFSVSDVSRRLGFPKSSTFMILTTLARRGYVERNERTKKFRFGLKLISVARASIDGLQLCQEARPFLISLMQKTGLTVHMAVLDGDEAVIVDKIDVPGPARITTTWVGRRISPHASGIGKALLAFLPEEELNRRFRSKVPWRYNNRTICSLDRLKKNLANIRNLGYSVSDQESQVGYRGVGAPVFDSEGKCVAAISLDGSTGHILLDSVSMLGSDVKRYASAISVHISHGSQALAHH
jgi:DNA-binding IclR family transcriptional regulator